MAKHFLTDIEIKDFKCFENFKAKGFSRVNLIGGKNNVGKTAFMEACYIIEGYSKNHILNKTGLSDEDREELYFWIIKLLLVVEENRKRSDFLLQWVMENFELDNFNNFEIELPKKFMLSAENNLVSVDEFMKYNYGNHGAFELSKYRKNKFYYKLYKKNNFPQIENFTFIPPCMNGQNNLKDMIDMVKINGQYIELNKLLKEIFNIDQVDFIKNKVMLKQDDTFTDVSDFGDGVRHFLHIVLALFVNKNGVIYLDEIDNGIHYTQLDKLWEIILTVSKEQNVQVFATTHSKECIESYARVAKKLEDKEITFIELCKREEEIKSFVYSYDWFLDEIEQEHEVRGCL